VVTYNGLFASTRSFASNEGTVYADVSCSSASITPVYFGINVTSPDARCTFGLSAGSGNILSLRYRGSTTPNSTIVPWLFNMKSLTYTDYPAISANTDNLKHNTNGFVLTFDGAEAAIGGNIQSAKIYSNEAPNMPYNRYLFSLPTRTMTKCYNGRTSMWFSSQADLSFRAPAAIPFNGLAAPDSVVNMHIISNVAAFGASNDSMAVLFKTVGWIDYTSRDQYIAGMTLVSHNDEWASIVSYVDKEYRFCENDDHATYMSYLKQLVTFLKSGDPKAVAIRKLGKAGLKYGGALAGSILL